LHHAAAFETPTLDLAARALGREPGLYSYGRTANPTVEAFERHVAALEGAEAACAAASGMGALAGLFLGLVRPGEKVAAAPDLYGTTAHLLDTLRTFGIEVVTLPIRAAGDASSIPSGTRLVFAEVISNPLLAVTDVRAVSRAAHDAGALAAFDATFATPFHCRPLELGADLVMHSATKFLGGHADLLAGVVAGRSELVAPIRDAVSTFGSTLAPGAAWLALRGLRTLALRMERQAANAAAVAGHLSSHEGVNRVYYPGLAAHASHGAARSCLERGSGAMVSFDLFAGAETRHVEALLDGLDLIRFVASLGDVATTVSHPASTSHRRLTAAELAARGISMATLRLSVGAEAARDLIADLDRGLARARAT
jgi:cystathionine beta-lyase/cystathionine gamma-synthase